MASELGESERPGENQSINSEQVKDSVELLATTNAPADIVTEGDDAENVDFQETKEINISTVPPDSPTENSLLLSSSVDNSMASNAVVVSTWSEVDDQQNTNISANNRCEFVWSETEEDAAVVNKVSSKNNGKGGNNNEEEDIITELRDKTVEELPSDCVQNEKTSQTQCEEIVPKDVENEMDCVGETKQSKDEKAGGGEKGEDEVEEGEEGRGGGEDGEDGEEVTVVRQRRSRLECRECGKRFTRRETYNLHRHFHMHQDEQASLTCKECGLTFQHRSSLIKHRNEHKAKNVPPLPTSERKQQNKECREDSDLQCDRCGGTFPTLIKLKLHACERSLEKLYRCPLCRKEFQYRVSINTHMQSHSFDSPFRCLECNKGFQCAATLHIHQRSHAALKPFECPDCGMVFRYRSIMEDHRRKHTEERPYQCSICGKSFKYGSLLNQHQYLHTGQKPYQCPDCGKKFAFAQNMRAHCRQHKKQPFICSQCPLTFPDSASLEMHIPSHKKPLGKTTGATGKENTNYGVEKRRDFKCPLCPEIFHKPVDLRTHMLIHEAEFERMTNAKSSDQTYFCPRCPLRFSNEAALQSHVLTHQPTSVPIKREVRDLNVVRADGIENVSVGGEWVDHSEKKPLKCRECGKCFRHRSVLQLHMRIHSKDRPYQCNVCFKTFRFSSYLQQHLIIHTGKKPYKCPDCGKGFAFLQNMRTHQRLHQQKPFRCTQCCKGYSDENQLQRHMLSHTGDKPYKCHLCDKSFGLAYLLRDHLNTHTGERPHRCQECNKSFPWLSSLVVHQKIHERKRLGFPSQRGITKSLSLPEKAGKGSEQQQLQLQLIQQLPQQLQRHQIPQHLQLLQQPQQIKLLRLQQPQPMQNLQQPEQLQKQQQATLQQQNQLPPAWVSAEALWLELNRAIMADVSSAKEGSLQENDTGFSYETEQTVNKRTGLAFLSSNKEIRVDGTCGSKDQRLDGPEQTTKHHAEVAPTSAFPPITIKEERIEDDEFVEIEVGKDEKDSSEERTASKDASSDIDESVDGEWQFRSVDCNEAFENNEVNLEHRQEYTHDGPIVCLDTDSQWDDLLVSVDGGQRTLCCALCGRRFSSSRGFFTHQLKHRNESLRQRSASNNSQGMVKQRLFECKDCGKTFSTVGLCLNHQRSHKQASKSVFHQLAHLKKKSFQCPTCGRCYSRASALDAHRRCHEVKLVKSRSSDVEKPLIVPAENDEAEKISKPTDEKEKKVFECSCGKSFSTACGLSAHQRFSATCSKGRIKETTKRLFDCTDCGKSFVSPVALSCHQRWHRRRAQLHSNGQPFKCEECGKVFSSLTFYHKHQRLAHSEEAPAKSFLHQVCQLQKKAFQCSDCGCRFSRASALQSHQLCHADVYGDISEKVSESSPAASPAKLNLCNKEQADSISDRAHSQIASPALMLEKDFNHDDAGVGGEDDETIDFEVEVVSVAASESSHEDNDFQQDQNPDLELVCESDQEEKEDIDFSLNQTALSTSSLHYKPEVDVKIVQINYESFSAEALGQPAMQPQEKSPSQEVKKFQCPECDRTFVKAGSLRCHRLWHRGGMGKKPRLKNNIHKANMPVRPLVKCEICGHESTTKTAHYFHLGKHEDRKPYKSIMYQLASLEKNSIKCEECGMRFSRVSALHSHQQHHNNVKKPFACLQCGKSYSNAGSLYNHRRTCTGRNPVCETEKKVKTENYNPKKTLLGPKVHHCKRCGKGFWSLGAFSHHKQYQPQCADVKQKNSSRNERNKRIRCPICGVKLGRKGGLAFHMLKHHKTAKKTQEKHKCEVCGKSYHFLSCFLKHKLVHDTEGVPPPAKSFDHQVEQVKKNTYSCPDCGKLFSRAMALQFHMKSHGYETGFPGSTSSKLPSSIDGPQCPTCLSHFTNESMLDCHRKHCGKTKEDVDGHSEGRETLESVKVEEPTENHDKGAKELNDSLKENMPETTSAELKYKCNDCGRSFAVVGALNFHKRIHRKGHVCKTKPKPTDEIEAKVKTEDKMAKAPFVCLECGRRFTSNSALGTHRRWHTDKKFAGFLSKDCKPSSLQKSLNEGPFLCNLCGKGFFYLCVLRRHQRHHPPVDPQPDSKSKTDTSVKSSDNPSKNNLVCPECGETFSGGSVLAAHFESCHAKTPETSSFQTNQAQTDSIDNTSYKVVKPTSSASTPLPAKKSKLKMKLHQCPHCSMSFLKIRGLRAHKWQKHRKSKIPAAPVSENLKPFPCPGCERRYSSQGALYNHRKTCGVVKKESKPPLPIEEEPSSPCKPVEPTVKCFFKCHKCGKAFPSEDQLEAHKEMAKTRPHSCALCCRGYWTETQLQQHLAWHDEVRRRLPTELRYRLGSSLPTAKPEGSPSHPTAESSPPKKSHKSHNCQHCGKAFLSPHALQQHEAVHKRDEPYHCSLCPRTFSEIRDLIDHHQDCLGEKEQRDSSVAQSSRDVEGLTCIECGVSFSQEMELHQHYIEHARGDF
ncbi:uncharacterized protein LOC115821543 [Chanos chanos]|uniref:Uncharacterized protein LOC115821543 n=1 Tax=Chanos chanos TaxID=29144 RepID=A0A6J2WAD4_CHACN|nr:uncharacterized protein LOC115821543 [Chanos chanos]